MFFLMNFFSRFLKVQAFALTGGFIFFVAHWIMYDFKVGVYYGIISLLMLNLAYLIIFIVEKYFCDREE